MDTIYQRKVYHTTYTNYHTGPPSKPTELHTVHCKVWTLLISFQQMNLHPVWRTTTHLLHTLCVWAPLPTHASTDHRLLPDSIFNWECRNKTQLSNFEQVLPAWCTFFSCLYFFYFVYFCTFGQVCVCVCVMPASRAVCVPQSVNISSLCSN